MFYSTTKILDVWMSEGIDYDVLVEFGVRFDMVRNRIVFPILDRMVD